MKREEAIKMLKQLVNMLSDDFGDSELCEEALQMAITALQNEPVWIPVSERLPEELVPVNVTWINRNPEPYYAEIKDVPFACTAVYYNGKWYWWSSVCTDYLKEYGEYNVDLVDKDIDIVAWMPLPEPYRESEPHKQTNADRIRSMTDKELAEMLSVVSQHCVVYLSDHIDCRHSRCESSCKSNIKKWLQKESEE